MTQLDVINLHEESQSSSKNDDENEAFKAI